MPGEEASNPALLSSCVRIEHAPEIAGEREMSAPATWDTFARWFRTTEKAAAFESAAPTKLLFSVTWQAAF